MKISSTESRPRAQISLQGSSGRLAGFLLTVFLAVNAFGQAPALLWTKNVGGRLFSVDAQTNCYTSSNGLVIKVSGSGELLQTNILSDRPGLAQRDSTGNFYFAGLLPGQFYGEGYHYDDPACFLLKYSAGGTLVSSNSFGPVGNLREEGNGPAFTFGDLQLDSDGNIYVAYWFPITTYSHSSYAAKMDVSGSNVWTSLLPQASGPFDAFRGAVRFGPISPTSGYAIEYVVNASRSYATLSRFDSAGLATVVTSWGAGGNNQPLYASPAGDTQGNWWEIEGVELVKRSAGGALLWSRDVGDNTLWTVAGDCWNGAYVASDPSTLTRHDSDGNPAWMLYLDSPCNGMLVDSQGNRFFSTVSGNLSRLGDEVLSGPMITNSLVGQTVFSGSNHVFNAGAAGSGPLRYFWFLNDAPLAGQTNSTLDLTDLTWTQTGNYSVIISNFIASVTNGPALLRVKAVQFFLGNQMLTNGTYNFITPPTLSVLSAFTNGSVFYTLDGSAPTFASTFYTGPFPVPASATVRALGYSADFAQSEEADSVNIVLPASFSLAATATPGGNVALNPTGGVYLSNTVVTVTATATNGWSFLYWQGDAAGTSPSVNVTVNGNKSVQAVFGSTLSTTVSGSGQVQMNPPGGVYPYGSVIRLTGIPQPGNYLGVWGNAASGSANPLYFTLTNPSPTVSSLFAPLPANQAALTVLISGPGNVAVDPAGTSFSTNQTVSLTATPLAGQGFINWSGDTLGTQNPINLTMTQSRVVTANFTNWPVLVANQQSVTPQGFQLSVLSGPGLVYQIQASSNLSTWTSIGVVTNTSGETLFTDPAGTNLPFRFYRGTPWP